MILELLAVGLVVSAFLAIQLDDAIYSVVSLAVTLILMAILYALNNAVFVAVFQLAIGVGTLAVLFLSSDMLSEKQAAQKSTRNLFLAVIVAVLLSAPAIFLSVGSVQPVISPEISFPEALWNLRAIDVVLQGLVIVTVALGIAIILRGKQGED